MCLLQVIDIDTKEIEFFMERYEPFPPIYRRGYDYPKTVVYTASDTDVLDTSYQRSEELTSFPNKRRRLNHQAQTRRVYDIQPRRLELKTSYRRREVLNPSLRLRQS